MEENCLMAKNPANHQKPWTPAQEKRLEQLADGNTPTQVIALKLQRTADAVRARPTAATPLHAIC
jgi:hypothetical protein